MNAPQGSLAHGDPQPATRSIGSGPGSEVAPQKGLDWLSAIGYWLFAKRSLPWTHSSARPV
ncbi:MAG TPA: hypothetical protein VF020_00830, partial [Chthoniobacterales bacterium]